MTSPNVSSPPPPPQQGDKRIPGLDGLRAISIVFVLFGHGEAGIRGWDALGRTPAVFFRIVGDGELGVIIFFVISGYLITRLMKTEWRRTGTISLPDFYRRRAFRIFPAFYFYLGTIVLLTLVGALSISTGQFAVACTYTWNYLARLVPPSQDGGWYLGHLWTLSIEEQFYLLWPLTLFFLRPKKAASLALALVCLTPLIRVASYFLFPAWRAQIPILLHTMWDTLMMGAFLALCEGEEWFERRIEPLVGNRWLLIPSAVLITVICPLLNMKFRGMFGITLEVTIDILAISQILLYVTRHPDGKTGRLLNHPTVVFVGTLSYSIYLWQQLFLGGVDKPWKLLFPFNLMLIFAAALFSYFLVEKPFLRLRHLPAAHAKAAS